MTNPNICPNCNSEKVVYIDDKIMCIKCRTCWTNVTKNDATEQTDIHCVE